MERSDFHILQITRNQEIEPSANVNCYSDQLGELFAKIPHGLSQETFEMVRKAFEVGANNVLDQVAEQTVLAYVTTNASLQDLLRSFSDIGTRAKSTLRYRLKSNLRFLRQQLIALYPEFDQIFPEDKVVRLKGPSNMAPEKRDEAGRRLANVWETRRKEMLRATRRRKFNVAFIEKMRELPHPNPMKGRPHSEKTKRKIKKKVKQSWPSRKGLVGPVDDPSPERDLFEYAERHNLPEKMVGRSFLTRQEVEMIEDFFLGISKIMPSGDLLDRFSIAVANLA